MKKKTAYRIRNWPAYNAALIGRGSLTLWVDEAAIRSWRYTHQVSADGAYDKRRCYDPLAARGARAVIPPRRAAKIWQQGNCAGASWPRDENLRAIRQQGRCRGK